ncbi:MAG TPA: ABC transporter permease subunit [Acidimicrobiia bacterium]|nr:ABC transporter permease subunit [Acidimicrobiia bacterium]
MTTTALGDPERPAAARGSSAVVARLTARKAARSGALWGYVFGVFVVSSALGYAAAYKTPADRTRAAATFANNAGIDALIGRGHQVQTVVGFTVWRSLGVLSVVGAVWAILASTRLLRGEEDAGRWELLLAGRTTRRGAVGQAMAGVAAGALALFGVTALVTVLLGRTRTARMPVGGALFFSVALVAGAVAFLFLGVLGSQLTATRRQAAAYCGGVLAVSYGLRLVADSSVRLGWLRWATPLGWVENLRPLSAPQPLALVPIAAWSAVAAAAALWCAERRDLGSSIVPDRTAARARTGLLTGPLGLDLRLSRSYLSWWYVGIAGATLMVGFISRAAAGAITASKSAEAVIARLGATGVGARLFLGVTLLVAAMLIALVAAGQVGSIRSGEAGGQLDNLLVRPVSRWRWYGSAMALATVGIVLAGVLAGACGWLGEAVEHSGVPFPSMLAAGVNLVPPALVVLGFGALCFGVAPRATSVATYGLVVWAFLVDLVGGVVGLNHWLLDTSLFHQMSPAPAIGPNWPVDAVMTALAVAAAAAGGAAFVRRDLAGA